MAGVYAKAAAEDRADTMERAYLRETSPAHMARTATRARSQGARRQISEHVKSSRRYRPSKGGGIVTL